VCDVGGGGGASVQGRDVARDCVRCAPAGGHLPRPRAPLRWTARCDPTTVCLWHIDAPSGEIKLEYAAAKWCSRLNLARQEAAGPQVTGSVLH
jgi:hypothetical protein